MRLRLRLRAAELTRAIDEAYEVVVLGGGPAACAAASLLAGRSHRVALVHPTSPPAGPLAESVPPSALRVLDELGFLPAVRAARPYANRGNTVWWAGNDARVEVFPEERVGFHVDRQGLEAVLAPAVEASGASIWPGLTARRAEETDAGWRLECDSAAGAPVTLRARWVVDATGRHGFLARREGRVPDRSTTTLALVRRWRCSGGWPERFDGQTLVESYPDGWAWSVPLSPEVRCFTAMVDQREADLDGVAVDTMLTRELEKTRWIGPLLDNAEPRGAAWACPASLYTSTRFARPGLVLTGDAGSFIDPLSSFGVKKALSSGWLAAIVVHTALTDATRAAAAIAFFDTREHEVYRNYRSVSAEFFERAAGAYGTPYWTARAAAARDAGGFEGPSTEPTDFGDPLAPPLPEESVRAAFDRIRERPSLDATRGSTLRTFSRPGIEGHRIVMRDHLASDPVPAGLRYVRGVDLAVLVDVAPRHADVPDGWAAYNRAAPAVTLPDYLTALATAFAAGFLEHAGEPGA